MMDPMPPLRQPRTTSPPRTPHEDMPVAPDRPLSLQRAVAPDLKPIKPTFLCASSRRSDNDDDDNASPAAPSLVPKLSRPEYYSSPSVEAMSKMSESKLSRIDNLEIGRYGYGSVRCPGLTDTRRVDFDKAITIDRG